MAAFNTCAVELGNNLTGTIGLNGEAFGSAIVNSINLPDASGVFGLSVPTGQGVTVDASMYDFQGTFGATLRQSVRNIGPITEGEILDIDLRHDSGRIVASVNITGGGSLDRLGMYSSSSTGNERFVGVAVGNAESSYSAIQPMPALAGTNVSGYAIVNVPNGAGCRIKISLARQSVDIAVGIDSNISWDLDTSNVDCSTGDLQGRVIMHGAPSGRKALGLRGPQVRTTSNFGNDGSYAFDGLLEGVYSAWLGVNYSTGYGRYSLGENAVAIDGGNTTVHDFNVYIGTANGTIEFDGPWGLADMWSFDARWAGGSNFRSSVGGASDNQPWGYGAGEFQLIDEEGLYNIEKLYGTFTTLVSDFQNDPYTIAFVIHHPSQAFKDSSATQITAETTTSVPAMPTIKTSESLVAFELSAALKAEGAFITKLEYSGSDKISYEEFLAENGGIPDGYSYYDRSWEYDNYLSTVGYSVLRGEDHNINDNSSIYISKIRGMPGNYNMTATAYHTGTGGTAGAIFQMVLSEPIAVETGDPAPQEFTDPAGEPIGTLDFENVTEAGSTTFSELTIGPDPEEGFSIFAPSGKAQYFDISSSASFEGLVQVCVQYDGSGLTDEDESVLQMGHYVNGQWENITEVGYPDIETDTLCGLTNSFSYFAILVSTTPPDSDGDGFNDDEDNCPLTPNPGQEDLDGDGIGNACEADDDQDGIINDYDLCPDLSTSENGDLDGDGIGDPCDSDMDGDTIDNAYDNCPTIANETQVNFDGDDVGDACDLDDDNDSVADEFDQCPGTSLGASVVPRYAGERDIDAGCTSGQLFAKHCPIDGAYRNHGAYVNCVVDEADRQVENGILLENERGSIVSISAQSNIGKK